MLDEGGELVIPEVRAIYEHACLFVVEWCECAEQPSIEILVLLCGVGVSHGLDIVEGSVGNILGQRSV